MQHINGAQGWSLGVRVRDWSAEENRDEDWSQCADRSLHQGLDSAQERLHTRGGDGQAVGITEASEEALI